MNHTVSEREVQLESTRLRRRHFRHYSSTFVLSILYVPLLSSQSLVSFHLKSNAGGEGPFENLAFILVFHHVQLVPLRYYSCAKWVVHKTLNTGMLSGRQE